MLVDRGGQRLLVAIAQGGGPHRPPIAVDLGEGREQRPRAHPRAAVRPRVEVDALRDALGGGAEGGRAAADRGGEVDPVGTAGPVRALAVDEPAVGDEIVDRQQERVARDRGRRGVRRSRRVDRSERQHLPNRAPGRVQPAQERARRRPDLADAVRTGQRRRVQQDACAPVVKRRRRALDDGSDLPLALASPCPRRLHGCTPRHRLTAPALMAPRHRRSSRSRTAATRCPRSSRRRWR